MSRDVRRVDASLLNSLRPFARLEISRPKLWSCVLHPVCEIHWPPVIDDNSRSKNRPGERRVVQTLERPAPAEVASPIRQADPGHEDPPDPDPIPGPGPCRLAEPRPVSVEIVATSGSLILAIRGPRRSPRAHPAPPDRTTPRRNVAPTCHSAARSRMHPWRRRRK